MESAEKVTVAYFFTIARKSIPFAFLSMAIDRMRSRKFIGISFSKLLGTGSGQTFTPSDAVLTRWGMVVVIDKNRLEAFDQSSIISNWRKRSTSEFRAVLSPLSSHGLWAKKNPFDFITPASSADVQIAAITRARIKWNKNFIFWKSVPPVVIDLHSTKLPSSRLKKSVGIAKNSLHALKSLNFEVKLLPNPTSKADLAHVDSPLQPASPAPWWNLP